MRCVLILLRCLVILMVSCAAFADDSNYNTANPTEGPTNVDNSSDYTSVTGRTYNPFDFSLYEPTYILPFYYSQYPDYSVYQGNTPDNQTINKTEVNFQLSFKVPIWRDLFPWPDTLEGSYTQDSFWQVYNESAFFRETDYEPSLFLDNQIDKPLVDGWQFSNLDIGVVHQSNGRGVPLERSWNRAFMEGDFTKGNWYLSIEPWVPIFEEESIDEHNPNITKYLGYGRELISYNTDNNNTFSFACRNELESGFSRGAEWLTWSFPLIHRNIKGYVYLFSGYGQNLIEYNHYTNSVGVGITLNDWGTKST